MSLKCKEQSTHKPKLVILTWVIFVVGTLAVFSIKAEELLVRAVLFYSPTCPHCHEVISKDLPPLKKRYGEQLQILGVNVREPGGQALYQAAIAHYHIPHDRRGVPTLIVGDEVLVGSDEIPARFPELVDTSLATGGLDWPPIPGLMHAVAATQAADAGGSVPPSRATESNSSTTGFDGTITVREKLARDPLGNGFAIVTLIGMLVVALHTLVRIRRDVENPQAARRDLMVPLLCLMGLVVAGYLTYIEVFHVAAVCGPVGDCNTVQQSEYARLFDVIPIGVLGLIGYLAILLAWVGSHYGRGKLSHIGRLVLFVLALSGTLFSIYLTFLEPFVIGATCAWCIASAVIMTLLLWRTRVPAGAAWVALFPHRSRAG